MLKKVLFALIAILVLSSISYALNINLISTSSTRPANIVMAGRIKTGETINLTPISSLAMPASFGIGIGPSSTHYYQMDVTVNFREISQEEYNAMSAIPTVTQQ